MLPRLCLCVAVALLGCVGCAPPPPEQDSAPPGPERPDALPTKRYQPIDEATCQAWERRRFLRCWISEDGSQVVYEQPQGALAGTMVPGFQGSNPPSFADLPPVNVPFGIDLKSEREVDDRAANALPALKNLVVLRIGHTRITDGGVSAITKIQSLIALELGGCYGVTKEGFKSLAVLKNLRSLNLWGSPVTDEVVPHLATLEKLTLLSIGGKGITDAGVKELQPLQKLTSLELWFANVTDAGVVHLADLRSLTKLSLSNTNVTDVGAKQLATMKQLTSLDVSYTAITDTGVKELAKLSNLKLLYLEKTDVTDEGMKQVKSLTRLQDLVLTHTKVTDAGIRELAALAELTFLDVYATKATDTGLKELAPLKKLTTIIVPLSANGFPETAKALPNCKLTRRGGP